MTKDEFDKLEAFNYLWLIDKSGVHEYRVYERNIDQIKVSYCMQNFTLTEENLDIIYLSYKEAIDAFIILMKG